MEDGMYVEYRDGDATQHFVSSKETLDRDNVRQMLEYYYAGDERFKELAEFELWNPYQRKGCLSLAVMGPLFLLLL